MKYEIAIRDLILRDEIIRLRILKDDAERPSYRVAHIIVSLENIDPRELNAHWPAIVDQVDGERKRILYGVITEIKHLDKSQILIVCRGSERYAEELRTNLAFGGFSIPERFFYVARRIPEVVTLERNIEGLSLNKNRRRFKVIMPIRNLTVGKPWTVLGVLLRPLDLALEDDRVIADNKMDRIWKEPITWAKTVVEAVYFDEAAIEARKHITAALDWVSYAVKLSVVGIRGVEGLIAVPWNRDRALAEISLGEISYVRDLSESLTKFCIYDLRTWRGEGETTLSESDVTSYDPLRTTFESLDGSPESVRLMAAIHWLRHARDSPDPRDRLLSLWITLEFLVAGVIVNKIGEDRIAELSRTLQCKADELGIRETDWLVQRFRDAVSNPSLRDRFESLVTSRSIPIENRESQTVWGPLRQNRNDLEHGKRFDIVPQDLDVMEQMLSKIILILADYYSGGRTSAL